MKKIGTVNREREWYLRAAEYLAAQMGGTIEGGISDYGNMSWFLKIDNVWYSTDIIMKIPLGYDKYGMLRYKTYSFSEGGDFNVGPNMKRVRRFVKKFWKNRENIVKSETYHE